MPLHGPSCKLRLARFSVKLKFQDGPSVAKLLQKLWTLCSAVTPTGGANTPLEPICGWGSLLRDWGGGGGPSNQPRKPKTLVKKIWPEIFFDPKVFLTPKKCWPQNFWTQFNSDPKDFLNKKIWSKYILTWKNSESKFFFIPQKFWPQNLFDLPKNFNPKTCWPKNTLNPKKFRPSKNVDPKTMRCQWGGGGGHSGKPHGLIWPKCKLP